MTDTLTISLLITLIGMLLVFGAIVLLWSVLGLLVQLTGEKTATGQPQKGQANTAAETLLKKRAAVAAVAVAMAIQETKDEPHEFPLPPTALVSPWQAVMRSHILNKRGNVR